MKYKQRMVVACFGLVLFFMLLGWIGRYDYCEQIILRMSQEQYDSIKAHLTRQNGTEPSEREIAYWWVEHHGNQ